MNSKLKLNLLTIADACILFTCIFNVYSALPSDLLGNLTYLACNIYLFIIVYELIHKPFSFKNTILPILLVLVSFISAICGDDTKLFQLTLMVLAFTSVNFDKFIARDVIIRTILLLSRIFLYFKATSFSISPMEGERIRYEFGLGHPNTLGFMLTLIGIEYLYLFRNKRSYFAYMICILISFFNYKFISSRTSLIILVFALFCFILMRLKINIMKYGFFKLLIENSYFIFTFIIFALAYLYGDGNALAIKVNDLFSNRIALSYGYIKEYGFSLFGTSVAYQTTLSSGFNASWLDIGYVLIILQFGLIAWLIYGIIFNRAFHYLLNSNKYYLVIILLCFILYGAQERGLFRIEFFSLGGLLCPPFKKTEERKNYELNTVLISLLISLLIMSYYIFKSSVYGVASFIESGNAGMIQRYNLLQTYFNNFISFKFPVYDFSLGLGSNIYTILSNNFFSPFNVFIPLLINSSLAYGFFIAIKLTCLCVFSTLWLNKLSKNRPHIITGSLIFTLSGIVLSYFGNSFTDVYCLIPLVLYFVEKYISSNKTLGLILSVIILTITNPSYLIIDLFIIISYVTTRYLYIGNLNFNNLTRFILNLLLSVGASLFITIPCILYANSLHSIDLNLFEIVKSLFTPTIILDNNYSMCASIGALSILPTFFLIHDKNKKTIISLSLLITFVCSLVLSVFFGLATYTILLVNYLYIAMDVFDNYNKASYKPMLISCLVILSISIIFTLISLSPNTFTNNEVLNILIVYIIFGFGILYLKQYGIKALSLVIVFELLLNTYNVFLSNQDLNNETKFEQVFTATNKLKKDDGSFYRVVDLDKADDYSNKDNENFIDNYITDNYDEGITEFTIKTNTEASEYISLIGAKQTDSYIGNSKNTLSLFNIAGSKYYIYTPQKTNEEISNGVVPEAATSMEDLAQKNMYIISNGIYYISSSTNDDLVLTASSIDEDQVSGSVYLSTLTYDSSQMWRVSKDANGYINITNIKTGKTLDINAADLTSGNSVIQFDSLDRANQKWVFIKRDESIEIASIMDWNKCLDLNSDNLIINDYNGSNTTFNFTNISNDEIINLPSYIKNIEGTNYYKNDYYIELGYVNNNLIKASSLLNENVYTIESVLKEYVAIDDSSNTNFSLSTSLDKLVDYTYDSPLIYETEEDVLTNQTLVIYNGGIPIVNVELYYDDTLVKTANFSQYDFCNVTINKDEYVNKVVIRFSDVDDTGYAIQLFTMKNADDIEEALYNQRILNSFTNVNYDNDYISGDINISEDNSLVYTYVPYDENWIVKVDGEKIETIKANYGFTAFRLNSGNHHVEFEYKVPHITLYIILSIISLIGLILINTTFKRRYK